LDTGAGGGGEGGRFFKEEEEEEEKGLNKRFIRSLIPDGDSERVYYHVPAVELALSGTA
jgi:hypothetical protein